LIFWKIMQSISRNDHSKNYFTYIFTTKSLFGYALRLDNTLINTTNCSLSMSNVNNARSGSSHSISSRNRLLEWHNRFKTHFCNELEQIPKMMFRHRKWYQKDNLKLIIIFLFESNKLFESLFENGF